MTNSRLSKALSERSISGLWQFARSHGDHLAGGFEHIVASAVSMIGLIVLTRLMKVDDFGLLALAMGIWFILEMIQQSVVLAPFLVSCPNPKDEPEEFGAWIAWNVVVSVAFGAILVAIGLVLSAFQPWMGAGFLLAVPITFGGMLFMFARRVHYHTRNRGLLIAQTFCYAAVYAVGLAWLLIWGGDVTPLRGTALVALAYAIPGILFTAIVLRGAKLKRTFLSRIGRARRLVAEFTVAGALWEFSQSAVLLALAAFSTPAAVAVFAITRTLIRPIMLLMSTLLSVDFSRASRAYAAAGSAGLPRVINGMWISLVVLTAIPLALLFLFPGFLIELVYGAQYADATLELQLRAALVLPLIYVAPLDTALLVCRDSRFLMRANFVGLTATAVSLVLFAIVYEINAATALASLIIARVAMIPMLHLRYSRITGGAALPAAVPEMEAPHVR